MRAARFLFIIPAVLALASCAHETDGGRGLFSSSSAFTPQQRADASTPSHQARSSLYSSSPANAQEAYAQPYNPPPVIETDRGFFAWAGAPSRSSVMQYEPPAVAPPVEPAPAVGGPYAAAVDYAVPIAHQPPYTLDSGDKLRIVVFGQSGISNTYIVDAAGNVSLPLIGSVTARGLTTEQLLQRIAARLKQGYVREPHVSVEIEANRPFFILGEVTTPGQYPYVSNMTAETAVAIAGGFAPRAFKDQVELTRTMHGQQIHATVPLGTPLRPGDTVTVKERWF